MAKSLRIVRHSKKGKDNNISPDGLALIEQEIRKGLCPDEVGTFFISPLIRTKQTVQEILNLTGMGAGFMKQIEKFDNQEIMAYPGLMDYYKANQNKSPYQIFKDVVSSQELAELEQYFGDGIRECFANLQNGETGFAVGHTPFINMGVKNITGQQVPEDMPELGYFDLIMDDQGKVAIEKISFEY